MFRITARTVLELGSELISSDIIAFYELIKNGFDAKTLNGVEIKFDIVLPRRAYLKLMVLCKEAPSLDDLKEAASEALLSNASATAIKGFTDTIAAASSPEDLGNRLSKAQAEFNTITVKDSGTGMSKADLEKSFLVIGTPSRKKAVDAALARGDPETPYLGEKGIGRLSAMRLGERLRVLTATASDSHYNVLDIDWRAFSDLDSMLDQIKVAPSKGEAKTTPEWAGTSVIVSDLAENWNESRVRDLA